MSNNNMYIPELPITKVCDALAKVYVPMINNNISFDKIPSPFLWGPPGVGKSQGVYQLADTITQATGKVVKVTDIRLLLFSPIDLHGVPVADKNREFTNWLKPKLFDLDANSNVVNIVFLDELSAAPPSVQAAAYQITLDRAVGEHKLPDNTIVIAAGNRVTDNTVAYKMPAALANRMMHFNVCADFETWKKWAIINDLHPLVLGFLSFSIDKLYPEKSIDEVAFPSPRTWMFVSDILNTLGDEVADIDDSCFTIISGCLGTATAVEFAGYCKVYKGLPKISDILDGKKVACPSTPDALYALISSTTSYIIKSQKADTLTCEDVENVSRFFMDVPTDYATYFFLSLLSVEKIRFMLIKSKSFMSWTKKHKNILMSAGYSIT